MAQLVDVFGFIAVLLRGLNLALTSLVVGGLVFATMIVPRSLSAFPVERESAQHRTIKWIRNACLSLMVVQSIWLAANTAILSDTTGLPLADMIGANYFRSGALTVVASLSIAVYISVRQRPDYLALAAGSLLIAANVSTAHAMARLENSTLLLVATAVHQAATAAWIGALPYWLSAIKQASNFQAAQQISRRFSKLALLGATSLVAAGIVLSLVYVGSPAAIYGTNYGVMLGAKILLTGFVLLLALFNRQLVRASDASTVKLFPRLKTFGEAEIGIAFTVLLAAASLTSQPPAVDLKVDRVTLPAIEARMTPRLPRLETPPLSSLTPSLRMRWNKEHANDNQAESFVPGTAPWHPPTPGDIAWSEYNHHWAGVIVLVVGILAVLSRSGLARWARHWPLAFLGLGVFLLLRADPESWPLGPDNFWVSFAAADVTQHRLFVVLIALFALFEWGVQTGRLRSPRASLVFPGVCAVGGALLMTHTHALSNLQEELLAELSHLPLAILGVVAGWARWLELRLPNPKSLIPARVWPACFVLIGVVLLLYREA